jgi:hypothetical protein
MQSAVTAGDAVSSVKKQPAWLLMEHWRTELGGWLRSRRFLMAAVGGSERKSVEWHFHVWHSGYQALFAFGWFGVGRLTSCGKERELKLRQGT